MARVVRTLCTALVLFILSVASISALYEDQAGVFDWKKSFVGKVQYAEFEGKRIIVATEENVLAALSFKSGQILWRHILEEPAENQFRLVKVQRDVVTVLGSADKYVVRGWDIQTGSINYEWIIYPDRDTNAEYSFELLEDRLQVLERTDKEIQLSLYNLKDGHLFNQRNIKFDTSSKVCTLTKAYYACLHDKSLIYTNLKDNTGLKTIEVQGLSEHSTIKPFKGIEPSVLVTINSVEAKIINLNNGLLSTVIPNAVGTIQNQKTIIYQLEGTATPSNILIKSQDLSNNKEETNEFAYPQGLGKPDILNIQCSEQCHLLFSTADDALLLVNVQERKLIWKREEALAQIVASEFLELPVSDLDASIEHEFDNNNVIGMFVHRISTQAKQLANFVFGQQHLSKSGLIRDDFGLHKIIVLATKSGKLFGLDTLTGSVAWTYRLPNIKPFTVLGEQKMLLFVQRSARYAPAVCTLLAEDQSTSNLVLFQFDPITGYSEQSIQKLDYKIKQALLLPNENTEHIKPLVIVSDTNQVHIYPQNGAQLLSNTYLYSVNDKGLVNGYNILKTKEGKVHLVDTWSLNLSPSEILSISTKPLNERVHSQGRVLPDRSVYYKYVNPNLIALATLSEDPVYKHVLNIHLIDGVSGFVVYSTSHKRAKGPVHLIHSENWLVYSYFSERSRRVEVVATELYEGQNQSNSTVFSSLAIGQIPQVEQQAYILPAFPSTMAVTLTERGITNKFLLFALNGGVIEIPWLLLQPRFDNIPCGGEEMCIPYKPEIPLPPEAFINYNQTLGRIKGITVGSAKLESTSHVLVYGLDLFYTRVAPSKTFDLLKEDFDHGLIVLVLLGLIGVSVASNYFASQKALKQAWK